MNTDPLERLRIASERKRRPKLGLWLTFALIGAATTVAVVLAIPRASDQIRSGLTSNRDSVSAKADANPGAAPKPNRTDSSPATTRAASGESARKANNPTSAEATKPLTVSGYIIARERIEISPRFMGIVTWIGVRKGDSVTNGQVVVHLDDSEYRARLADVDGQIGVAKVAVQRAELDLKRAEELVQRQVEMQKALDDARLNLATAKAQIRQLEASRQLITTWIDWCTIRSPIDGVVLEKLADANELVTPQNFGGGRGPSTSLIAVADLNDLQVELDLNETYLSQIRLGQACRVAPEAYPDRTYEGRIAEIAPEASRQKGTIQVKVQVLKPDRYLVPELSAKVDVLRAD